MFIQVTCDEAAFFRHEFSRILSVEGASFFLYYGDNKRDIFMNRNEQAALAALMNADFCMSGSVGFSEGDRIRVVSGPLKGLESRIKKLVKRRKEAIVEMTIMNDSRDITLLLDLIELDPIEKKT